MKKDKEILTIERIRAAHRSRHKEIRSRLAEFESIRKAGRNERLWEEMVFCFFTGGCSARMGLNAVNAGPAEMGPAEAPEK